MMPGPRVLLAFLCAQATFGQVQLRAGGLQPVDHDNHPGDLDLAEDSVDALSKAAGEGHLPAGNTGLGSIVVPAGDRGLSSSSGVHVHPADRDLQEEEGRTCISVDFMLMGCNNNNIAEDQITLWFMPPGHVGDLIDVTGWVAVVNVNDVQFENGKATGTFDPDTIVDRNGDNIAFNQNWVVRAAGWETACQEGNVIVTNLTEFVKPVVEGDPHMVGLLGQKIDWAGEDHSWYCLLSDGPDFQINLRLSAPMKEEFPDRQLVSAVSLLTGDGHSLVIEVKDPYTLETDGCPEESSPVPCLAEGGVRILVDGEVSGAMQIPGDGVHLPGGVVVSAANLLPECRPFGGDRIWAAQFEQMTAGRRSLRGATTTPALSFSDWILQGDTLAAPTWCAKLLDEGGPAGLLSASSSHTTVRIETEVATIRVNVGANYQDLETGADGTVLVPELEFWQTDLGFDRLHYSDTVAGLLGDTSRFVLDDEGLPVTTGLGALHGPVESYRVDGPLGRVFEKMPQ